MNADLTLRWAPATGRRPGTVVAVRTASKAVRSAAVFAWAFQPSSKVLSSVWIDAGDPATMPLKSCG